MKIRDLNQKVIMKNIKHLTINAQKLYNDAGFQKTKGYANGGYALQINQENAEDLGMSLSELQEAAYELCREDFAKVINSAGSIKRIY